MSNKVKSAADKKLIEKIFSVEPIDWARYENGVLAFISPTGQKFSYEDGFLYEQQQELEAKAAAAKKPELKKETEEEQKPKDAAGAAAK